jgi:hypothetical protein
MIRYHQFFCSGLKVIGNYFRAKPCDERLVSGFEGDSRFVDYNTNNQTGLSHGECEIIGNTIIGGRGDLANVFSDNYIYLFAYGAITVYGNTFGGTEATTNATTSAGIVWNSEAVGNGGQTALTITGNTFGVNCDYMDNISISNGTSTSALRRLKSLVVTGNTSLGQNQYFVKMASTNTVPGVQDIRICENNVNGEFNTFRPPASTNSRAIEVSGVSGDVCDVSRNTIRSKFYGIETNNHTGRFVADYNEMVNVTTRWLGNIPIITDRRNNAPSEAAADSSIYVRENGSAGNSFYVRQSGAWTLIG